eukprot:CAMPEP_0182417772 /NCGR_PEP_ID=MMETSP1167-20130531/2206_1 /TAXON_ID=2988 /ORGANISM="Mallomonas Sp, Strain CCMP3275" /LENGTH=317 /DNA_ID=CAMNT_0024591531 /DNA_START=543 /DNA_END=1492 /DNA_ORIENTATION=+
MASKSGSAMSLISPLTHAIEQLPVGPSCLTALHADLLQVCLSAHMYSYGYKYVINRPVLEVNMKLSPLTGSDFLRYFYYAALLSIGLKHYVCAFDYLTQVVCAPTSTLSVIAVDALKKASLLSLIHTGVPYNPPKGAAVSLIVQKFLKQSLPVYDPLVKAFQSADIEQLRRLLLLSQEALDKDGNLGLAKQLVPALVRSRIRTLATSYMTLSLQDIGSLTGLNAGEVESTLLGMLSSSEIQMHIDQQSGMAHFTGEEGRAEEEEDDASDVISRLQHNMSLSMELAEELRRMQKSVLTSQEYIARVSTPSHGGMVGTG